MPKKQYDFNFTDVRSALIEKYGNDEYGRPRVQDRDGYFVAPCLLSGNHRNDDAHPSMSVSENDGRVLVKCHKECDQRELWDSVRTLMDGKAPARGRGIEAIYDYVDEDGELLFQVVRKAGKTFRQRQPDGKGGWAWKLGKTRRVPYRLPEVIAAAKAGETVHITEGEKDADAIVRTGGVATCNPMGAKKWRDEFSPHLAGAKVVIVRDKDDDGAAHARQVRRSLLHHAVSVEMVEAKVGKDAHDHLEEGFSLDDFVSVVDDERDEQEDQRAAPEFFLPSPNAPLEVAREFLAKRFKHPGGHVLHHWRGGWWQWFEARWAEVEQRTMAAEAYRFTELASYFNADGEAVPWAPTRRKIGDLLDALAAVTHEREGVQMPSWLNERAYDGLVVALSNGLLDVATRELLPHDPTFFNSTSVPFPYDPDALVPDRWLAFLNDLWPDDPESIAVLQEWFGYVISGRTDLHKILLIVGPTRGGKGAIARVLTALIGTANVAGPTLSSLGGEFGLAPLLGKSLAVVSDARLDGRNSSVVVERLLSVSGEDHLTVNRKYRDQWTGKLPARFMLLSNELPQLGDASAAIAGRFVTLLLSRSWFGEEDRELEPALHTELPGILNWALDGLARLQEQGKFTHPDATDEAFRALIDLSSPVKAFMRECCTIDREHEVEVDHLYKAWRKWAEVNGHPRKTKPVFGRDLRAAVPMVKIAQRGRSHERRRVYVGISVNDAAAHLRSSGKLTLDFTNVSKRGS